MKFKKVEPELFDCTRTTMRPFGCMELWAGNEKAHRSLELAGLEGLPLGYITGETYNQQSVRLNHGDMILAFSDGATEARSPMGEQLTSAGFLGLAEKTLRNLPAPLVLQDFSRALIEGVHLYGGQDGELDDDITLLTLRRVAR